MIAQQNGYRIGFFTGRAAGHPDPNRAVGALALEQTRNDLTLQRFECLGVPKEIGDADQQVLKQQLDLSGFLTQPLDEIGHPIDLQHLHAALNAAETVLPLYPRKS